MKYQGTDAWHAERRTGYGASDAPVLIDGDEAAWRQLHGEKLGLLPPREATETMDLGKRLEDVIAKVAAERMGEPLRRVNRLIRHPDLPYVFASLDRIRRGGVPVELKKWGWKSSEWGQAGSDTVPLRILYQVQQQAAVTGSDSVDVGVLFGGAKFELFTVGRDETIIHEILELETAAWAFVQRGEMPPWPGVTPERIVLAHDEVPLDDALVAVLADYEQARKGAASWEAHEKLAKDFIRERLADAGGAKGVLPDGRKVSIAHRPTEPTPKVAWELVASAYRKFIEGLAWEDKFGQSFENDVAPDLDAIESMFTTTPEPTRPLRVTIGKGTT